VIDSDGTPLDGKGPIRAEGSVGMAGVSINPLAREPITTSLDVGVRAINAMLPIGRGQRVGLFAGSGVGKSTLLGMMTRFTAADRQHGVDGAYADIQRGGDGFARQRVDRHAGHADAAFGADRALAVQRGAVAVDDAAEQAFA
ncbi:hypothetical protein BXO557_20230, partial [Xanthomonas oryzae pv. oryzae]